MPPIEVVSKKHQKTPLFIQPLSDRNKNLLQNTFLELQHSHFTLSYIVSKNA